MAGRTAQDAIFGCASSESSGFLSRVPLTILLSGQLPDEILNIRQAINAEKRF